MIRSNLLLGAACLAICMAASAQIQPAGQNPQQTVAPAPNALRPDYELGPNDQIIISVPQASEINGRPFRINGDGDIVDLPLINRVHAAGLTVRGLEAVIATQLRDYVRDPQVSITVTVFRSEPVFFTGAFRVPGMYALQGGRTLTEMVTIAGGLLPTAGRRIRVTRRNEYGAIDLPNAVKDPARRVSYIEIGLDSLTQNINPAEDLVLRAGDIVSAETAQPVLVTGEVTRQGPVELGEESSISVTQALTRAGGFTQAANRGKARVLRPILGTSRRAQIEINLNRIYEGKDNDFPLLPNDMLYIPRASLRMVLAPVGTSLLTTLPYLVISLAAAGSL